MKPDDQRTFGKGNGEAVVLAVGLWAARDGMLLPIDMTGDSAHTTVTNSPGSARDHRILFRDLRRVLMANGFWKFGDEGTEGQATGGDED
ncbi:MAG TPA: hypothetical protein VGU25_04690 [Acidobacteriaceae bacterium]|nr:hypothetical protein [Acidobacteriaceae bacterium]